MRSFRDVFGLDEDRRPLEYIQNDFEDGGEVVIDHATGLTWQRSGSDKYLLYDEAGKYIEELNRKRFAGYGDWRLPTIPELMSLLEPEKQSNGLYIDPIFDMPKEYPWYWSADGRIKGAGSSGSAWTVDFSDGFVDWLVLTDHNFVRGVRS